MAQFPEIIAAQLRGATVRVAPLVRFDFRSGMRRLWNGFGSVHAGDGEDYEGLGGLGAVGGIPSGWSGGADEVPFSLSATPEMLGNLAEDQDESKGRIVDVLLQFFDVRHTDDAGNWVEWKTLDGPIFVFSGTMGPLSVARPQATVGEQATRTISVSAINFMKNRRRPPFAFYSDTEQKARHPGDQMFRNMSDFLERVIHWPEPA